MALEQATGRTLNDLLTEGVIRPLGLERTTLPPVDLTSPQLRGYHLPEDRSAPVEVSDDLLGFGNGAPYGVLTTADELSTTLVALMQGRLVPQQQVDEMIKISPVALASGYHDGLGLET